MADTPDDPQSNELNSPDLSTSLKGGKRAITEDSQLKSLVTRLSEENSDRNRKNARIMQKYNAERPYTQSELDAEGLGWKSNFSSQPLAMLVDRIAPRFVRAATAAKFLTSSKLPDKVPGAAEKTDVYRTQFTKLCRGRKDWKSFIAEVAQEDALFGYTSAVFTDEFSWWPRHFRQDQFFVPEGTKQSSDHCQLLVVREPLLVHEFYKLISDKEAAKDAGWILKNCVDAINTAVPDDMRSGFSGDERRYADMQREATVYTSHGTGAKMVVLWHVFIAEYDGQISHYIVDDKDKNRLFERTDRFKSMSEVTTFFSFQQANGNLKGSKGVGRTVYALAGIIDRSRNEVVDRLQLSGKVMVQGEAKDLPQLKMSVVGNTVFISKAFTLSQQKIDSGVEPFVALDNWVLRLMDELAGNISPAAAADQMQGERVTNGQINFIADLQSEAKDVKIERFMAQLADLMTEVQRRAAHVDVDDPDAKDFQARCLEVMSREELDALANQPAASTVEDLTDRERQNQIIVMTEIMNDPLVDRRKALSRKITAACGAEIAEDVLLPDEDPKVVAEQGRLQMLENLLIQNGQQVPVSPRDNAKIHVEGVLALAEQVAPTVAQDPARAQIMSLIADHAEAHITAATEAGTPPEEFAPYAGIIAKIREGVQTIAAAAQEQVAAGQPPQV